MQDLELEFTEGHLNYMKILFYSFNLEIDTVPYTEFIDSYGSAILLEESSMPE